MSVTTNQFRPKVYRKPKDRIRLKKREQEIFDAFEKAINKAKRTKISQIINFELLQDEAIWPAFKHIYRKRITKGIKKVHFSTNNKKFEFRIEV